MSKTAVPIPAFPWSLTKIAHRTTSLLAALAVAASAAAVSAEENTPLPFERALRRTVTIEGAESRRFELAARMAHYRVPGLSVAVIEDCRIVDARGFGSTMWDGPPVTPETRFQAGSISKSVTAIGALRLVERGTLSLDGDVQLQMKGWSYDKARGPVTLRQLLSHTAGTNLEGMKGYLPGEPRPTLAQILRGEAPANTPAIVVESNPGSRWNYSGGGYIVTQALMGEVTGKEFAPLMHEFVLEPLAMASSSFEQPPSDANGTPSAQGTSDDGSPLPGKWRVYPEMAPAGLWSTPSDLGRFAIGLARSVRGESGAIIGKDAAAQLMTRGPGNWGLGVDLGPTDGARQISHTGKNVGFTSMFIIYPDSCQGAVVMTNGYDGGWLINEVMRAISDVYRWPAANKLPARAALPLSGPIIERFVGTYRLRDFPAERFSITRNSDGELVWAREGHVGRSLLPETEGKLFSPDSVMTIEALSPSEPRASAVKLSFGGGSNIAERTD